MSSGLLFSHVLFPSLQQNLLTCFLYTTVGRRESKTQVMPTQSPPAQVHGVILIPSVAEEALPSAELAGP